jgi:hypothetical protein
LGDRTLILVAGGPVLLLTLWCWHQRSRWMSGPVVARGVMLALLGFTGYALARIGSFLAAPRYQAEAVRTELAGTVPAGASVAGDWAPFFTLGTELRPLYMNQRINHVSRVPQLRPDYFLYSETPDSISSFEGFAGVRGARLGPALWENEYNHRVVRLHQILYTE